jgi:16S rRNA (guanine527-N7)-methyltransferase
MKDEKTLLLQGIERIITVHSPEIVLLLERYIKEIELFNPAYGLVGVGNTTELIIKHILDSLAPFNIISQFLFEESHTEAQRHGEHGEKLRKKVADVGSGAGLPGIPLAIALPNCDFTLIERMGRRAGFLLNTIAALGLSNITVEENDLERMQGGCFDLVTFRAFKPLDPKLVKTLIMACAPGGIIAAYKGKREKIEEEMAPLQTNWEVIRYKVPFLDEQRHLLVIRS